MSVDDKKVAFRKLFDLPWQKRFLAILCRDRALAGQALSQLKADYFQNPHERAVVRLVLTYLDEYHNTPQLADLRVVARNAAKGGDIIEEDLTEILELVDWCYEIEIPDSAIRSASDQFIHFCRLQAMTLAIIDASELVQQRPIQECEDEIRAKFDQVSAIGKSKQDLGINLYDLPSILLTTPADEFIPTYATQIYPQLDQAMGGGFGRGSIYCIQADKAVGKTTLLINLASALVWRGFSVYHITLELSEPKTAMRYGSRLLRTVDWKDIHGSINELKKRLEHMRLMGGGQLFIKEFPTRSLSMSGLRGHMMLLETQGVKPDILVVDYADLMRMRGQEKRHEELELLYENLRGLGQEMGCSILTASQSNRIGASKFRPTSKDISGSYGKAAVVDGLIGICRTSAEKAAGLTRMYILKSRDADWAKTIWLKTDLKRAWMVEMSEVEVPEEFLAKERRGGRKEKGESDDVI